MTITFGKLIPKEITNFKAHSGECSCGGIVKMARNNITLDLEPDKCWCLNCGQHYFVKIKLEDLHKWDTEQWRQKFEIK